MSQTDHAHAQPPTAPVEGDGISYSGIIWFVVILTVTTLFCQALVWGMFEYWAHRAVTNEAVRSPLAAPMTQPKIESGHLSTGTTLAPQPGLLVSEPTVLGDFRAKEDHELATYGWVDKTQGTIHIPIDRAKALVLERGLPVRK